MPVKIMYQNDTLGEIEPFRLDELISSNKIKKIFRSGGWASVATAPMRGRRRRYEGPERRRIPGGIISLRSRCNLSKSASEQLRPERTSTQDSVDVWNKASVPQISQKIDSDVFSCLECGRACEEEEILDGSTAGVALLMKCTNDICGKYFRVIYDSLNLLESVTPVQRERMTNKVSAGREFKSNSFTRY